MIARFLGATLVTSGLMLGTAAAESAHQHGVSELSIAIEGNTMQIMMEVPAMDAVGFEHEPENDQQRGAIEQALSNLKNETLFTPSPEAGCSLTEASAEREQDADHSGFEAMQTFTCSDATKLRSVETRWFDVFAGAQEIEVRAIGSGGQTQMELERGSNAIDLTAIND